MKSVVGTWRLVKAEAHDTNGRPLPEPYGGQGMGRLTLSADGRMASVVVDPRRELPPGEARDYSSYCGNYTVDGATLTTRVDAASDPARLGSDQCARSASTAISWCCARHHAPVASIAC